jgi:predicted DNA-binding protein
MTDYTDDSQESSGKPGPVNSQQTDQNRHAPAFIEKFVIRLPKGLRNKIKHLSEQNRRSMNSEIIMVLEKHIQQHLADKVQDFSTDTASFEGYDLNDSGMQRPSDSELSRRLENLPEEKKQALLELLG